MSFTVFHQIERYYVASQVIQRMRSDSSTCRVLEVGAGRHANLLQYFPQDEVLFTDIIYTPEELQDSRFMYADVTQLPFEDGAFDYVIGLDVLEHIPAHQRKLMLQETYRVARCGVFLSFPHDSTHPPISDELAAIYRFFQKEPPVWLHEHDEMGLPRFADIQHEAFQIVSPSRLYTAHAVDYELNRIMLRLEAYTSCNPSLNDFFVQVNSRYTQSILQHDLGAVLEDAVKSYLILAKEPIAPELREKLDPFFTRHDQKLISQFRTEVVGGLRQWLADQLAQEKEGIAPWKRRI